ncbi:MAG: helix-turn-helix domain-containing protein, partial [Tannerellaceae bacterium]|nr:helix-turn-helix domain-containing protein [Tannerellaceae bacterium]
NYTKEHSVPFYAKSLNITLQHFCNTIKKVTGKKALEIISGMIIADAKAQLKSTNLPIKDIGTSVGFSNHAFFNKFFKQHTGMTPQEYRKNG